MLWILLAAMGCDGGGAVLDDTATTDTQDSADTGEVVDSDVLITALVAGNKTGEQDEAEQFEDWLELTNLGDAPVDLEGMGLTDGYPEEEPWRIPQYTLAPGDSLRIWCDEDPDDGPLHADFKLAKGGETVTLLSAEDAVLDRVSWSDLGDDEVYVRTDDGWEVE